MVESRCLWRWVSGLLLGGVVLAVPSPAAEPARPNVVILLADDAGWGDYSRNGNLQVATPNIDSLAAAGVTFERFFVCPLCAPTRAEFLTGRYYPRTGVYGVSTGQERMDLDETTMVLYFSDNGPNSWRWNGGMKGVKGTIDEGGVRSICHLRWPAKLPAGRTVRGIAGAIDLLPTLTALAGVARVGDKPSLEIPGREVMQVRAVTLTLLP